MKKNTPNNKKDLIEVIANTKPVTIISGPKPKFKKLDLVSGKDSSRIVGVFSQLQMTEGWMAFCQIIQANVDKLEKKIITKYDDDAKRPLTDVELDSLRDERAVYVEVMEYPRNQIESNSIIGTQVQSNDPYRKKVTRFEEANMPARPGT